MWCRHGRACRIATNASEPLLSLEKPCCMKPNPTIKRSGTGAQRAIGNRLDESSATSRARIIVSIIREFIAYSLNGFVASFGLHELSYATHVPEQIKIRDFPGIRVALSRMPEHPRIFRFTPGS